MPSSTFFGMQHLNGNLLCAVATKKIQHQLFEVAVCPLDHMLVMHKKVILFNMRMIPLDPDSIEGKNRRHDYAEVLLRGAHNQQVADYFEMWFKRIGLNPGKKIIPLCYDWLETGSTLRDWLGVDRFDDMFDSSARDVKVIANFINDNHDVRAEPVPFSKQTFRWIMDRHYVESHAVNRTAIEDVRQLCEVYPKLVKRGLLSAFDAIKLRPVEETHQLGDGSSLLQ